MYRQKFPEGSSGMVYGPDDRPVRRTRAHRLAGYTEPVAAYGVGRNEAYIDEEGAWLNAAFLEPEEKK